ncbi:MAG: hypothetical protein PWP31_863 [Clostridia bacterium]|nr:hypothetical protein [Clostridia bacterium]
MLNFLGEWGRTVFIENLLSYIEGYIILDIKGDNPENFLNLALERRIRLWDILRNPDGNIRFKMPVKDYRLIRPLARESNCRVHIMDKRGLPFFINRLRGRKFMVVGFATFFITIYFLSTFIWVVDVKPENGPLRQVTVDKVISVARQEGLKPGVRKNSLDIRALEHQLEQRLPQVAWVGISFSGTKANINLVEKAIPPKEDTFDRPASIIAVKDGVIKQLLVINGEGRVAVGDTVRRGEVLISGLILPSEPKDKEEEKDKPKKVLKPRLVRAKGIVRARVWYGKKCEINRQQVQEIPTGRQQTAIKVITSKGQFFIKGSARHLYKNYQQDNKVIKLPSWGKFSIPVELVVTTYSEVKIKRNDLKYEQAVSIGTKKALDLIKKDLPKGAKVIARKIIPLSKPEDKLVRIRVLLETEEEIGKSVPLKGKIDQGEKDNKNK